MNLAPARMKLTMTPDAACNGISADHVTDRVHREHMQGAIIACATAIFVAVACLVFGRRQFGGFDHSVLIDIGWRLSQGQKPYVDFPCTVPIWWALGIGLCFQTVGPSWFSVVLLQAVFAACTCIWMYWLLYGIWQDRLRAAMVSLAIQCGINLVTSYWWYNTLTATAACLVHLSLVRLSRSPSYMPAAVSCVLSMALLLGSKPNVAMPMLAASSPLIWLITRSALTAIAVPGCAVLLALAGLTAAGVTPFQVGNAYRTVAGRGLTIDTFATLLRDMDSVQRLFTWLLLGSCVAMAFATTVLLHAYKTVPGAIAAVTATAAVIGFITNGEHKLVDLSILLCVAWSTYAALHAAPRQAQSTKPSAERALAVALTALCCLWIGYGLYVSASRERVRGIGPFYDASISSTIPHTTFFRSLRASEEFLEIESEVARVLDALKPTSVFFGPRMQWAYAAFDLESPRNEPVWWHPGVSYGRDQEADMLQAWRTNDHDVLVFYRQDATYLSDEMLRDLRIDYMPVAGTSTLSVFVAREQADAFQQRLAPKALD